VYNNLSKKEIYRNNRLIAADLINYSWLLEREMKNIYDANLEPKF